MVLLRTKLPEFLNPANPSSSLRLGLFLFSTDPKPRNALKTMLYSFDK
jgi:hypothetical protein